MTRDDHLGAELEALELSAPADLPPRPPLPGRAPRSRWLWLPAAVMLLVGVLLGGLGTQWLAGLRSTGSSGPTASMTHLPGSPSPSNATRGNLAWSLSRFQPETGAAPAAIAVVAQRLIVTGSLGNAPAAWYSDDLGATWQRSVVDNGGDERFAAMGRVASSGLNMVSLGYVNLGAGDADRRAELWLSDDGGLHWHRLSETAVPAGMRAVAPGGPGFVAVGAPPHMLPPSRSAPQDAVWLSADGLTWELMPGQAPLEWSTLNGVVAENGQLVAVGSRRVGSGDVPAAWYSTDGRTWTQATLPAALGSIQDVTTGPEGFVAVGSGGSAGGYATAWRSADGMSWTAFTLDGQSGLVASRVASGAGGVVAAGRSVVTSDGGSLTWFAPPGGDASRQPVDADLFDVAADGDRFVGIGSCGFRYDCAGPLLVIGAPSSANATPSPTVIATPSGMRSPVRSSAAIGDLVGTLGGDRDLETGCAWVTDAAGKQWEVLWPVGYRIAFPSGREPVLLGPDGTVVAHAGDRLVLSGGAAPGMGSYCMVGELFRAVAVHRSDTP